MSNTNPILNASKYLVDIPDGTQCEILNNTIAEGIFYHQIIHEIVDNKNIKYQLNNKMVLKIVAMAA